MLKKQQLELNIFIFIGVLAFVLSFPLLCTACFANQRNATEASKNTSEQATSIQKQMMLTATIPQSKANFMVNIPESVRLGKVSIQKDLVQNYEIDVDVEDIGGGFIEISAEEQGYLQSENDKLKYSLEFDTKHITQTETVSAVMTIKKEDIAKAKTGSYKGTANFEINYTQKLKNKEI